MTSGETATLTGERADLTESLQRHRGFLVQTTVGVTDEQAAQRTTVSALCLGGLIKHVAATEKSWTDFIVNGPAPSREFDPSDPETGARWARNFQMLPGETLAGVLAEYEEVASRTDELVATLPDLDSSHPLPVAPWFPPGARWTARRVLLHILAETSQHAGHADIIREALDGAKTMG
jgi:hypothetical protein